MYGTAQASTPSFQFCGITYDEVGGIYHALQQIKELPREACGFGTGAIYRIRYDNQRSDPSHLAALFCDFSKQILFNSTQGNFTVTCVIREEPPFY